MPDEPRPTADPTLAETMAEVLALLENRGVAGMIFLSLPPFGEVGYNLTTPWSCATMINREFQSDATDPGAFKKTAMAISCLHQLAAVAVEDTSSMLTVMGTQRPFQSRVETQPGSSADA